MFSRIGQSIQNSDEQMMSVLQKLAKSYSLTYLPPTSFGNQAEVIGDYRGYRLILSSSSKRQFTRIKITAKTLVEPSLSAKDIKRLGEEITGESITRMLLPSGLSYSLRGFISVKKCGQTVNYMERWPEYDLNYLRFVLNLMVNLANAYPKVVELGGEAIPALQTIATRTGNELQSVTTQVLQDISGETKKRLRAQGKLVLCPYCLTHPNRRKVGISWFRTISYYGCRVCGQSREFIETKAIAVLDKETSTEQTEQDGYLLVNWFARQNLFDFCAVRILQATDKDVEGFAIQIGNDTDKLRKKFYRKMECLVSIDCGLSENTMRILQHTFGQVKLVNAVEMRN